MHRRQFETYLDKVFDWAEPVTTMAEGRQNPAHRWPKVFDAVFWHPPVRLVRFTGWRPSAGRAYYGNASDR